MRKAGTIPTTSYEQLSSEFEKFRSKRPLVIRDFLSTWPSKNNWDWKSLTNIVPPEKIIEVFVAKDGTHFLDDNLVVERVNMEFGSALESIMNVKDDQPRLYFRDIIIEELMDHVHYPDVLFGYQTHTFNKKNTMLWIGSKGNITPLHYDRCHGILCQLKGTKTLTLFRPKDTRYLYQKSAETGRSHTTHLIVERLIDEKTSQSELQKFQKVKRAKPYTFILNEGECIYIPPGWWHHVVHNDNSISVTLAWDLQLSVDTVPINML